MEPASRRAFLLGAAIVGGGLLASRSASATLVRGLRLDALVGRSRHIVLLVPLESHSSQVEIAGRASIVTDTRVQIEEQLAKLAPTSSELWVRTLGGRVGKTGEIVHGQAELVSGAPAVAFLKLGVDGAHWFVGMAQGHYPLSSSARARARLTASRNLPTIRDWEGSAVEQLVGKPLVAARRVLQLVAEP